MVGGWGAWLPVETIPHRQATIVMKKETFNLGTVALTLGR
jgi:hypothetical protein